MRIGEVNELQILRFASSGAYLGDEEGNDVLLPGQYLNEDMKVDDKIDVFLYRDSEDRLVATTQTPLIELNGFAHLKVVSVTLFGAFVDWGLEKDLMIPFREQNLKLEEGNTYLVCLLHDEATDRLYGSTKISKHLQPCEIPYDPETEVDLLICDRSDLGLKVVVDNRYSGLIYTNDITKPLRSGDHAKGYVYNVREDGKLDVRFDLTGGKKILDSADQLLEILKTVKKLPLHDKSSPEDIRDRLGMSKKTFKQAVGTLYKRREIILTDDGIEIV